MGTVVRLDAFRAGSTLRRAAERAPSHPALRWLGGDGLAHSRGSDGDALCGLEVEGVALPGTGLCPECFR